MTKRNFKSFKYKDSNFRICCNVPDIVEKAVISLRNELEHYIESNPEFKTSLVPVDFDADAPESARRMMSASEKFGVGPMAAVAGTIAQMACEESLKHGADEVIIDNGGDCYFSLKKDMTAAVFAANSPVSGRIAFRFTEKFYNTGVCSSSSKMGHSLSLGRCDLVTIFSKNNSIADAAATSFCNCIKCDDDISDVLKKAEEMEDIEGIFIIMNEKIAMAKSVPEIIKINSDLLTDKIVFDSKSPDASLILDFYHNKKN